MKKDLWQDALNETDEKWAAEYAVILEKTGAQNAPAKNNTRKNSSPRRPRWIGLATIAACLSLVLITTFATGGFKRVAQPSPEPPASHEALDEQDGKNTPGESVKPPNTETPAATVPTEAHTLPVEAYTVPAYTLQPADASRSNSPAANSYDSYAAYEMQSNSYYKSFNIGYDGLGLYGPPENWNTEEYAYIQDNSFLSVKSSPFSTFAADVDTASYANLRRMIRKGQTIPRDSVRIEELINYFHYTYTQPREGEPFGVSMELADCPWNSQAKLLLIGLQAKGLEAEALPASNLVFLIDVSGSMGTPEKLPLVQRSFMTLAENLTENDRITIITYSGEEKLVLDGVKGSETARIMGALEELTAYGSTNGERALRMAYAAAERHYISGGNNRIILATDGDFNIGITSESELVRLVQEKAKSGVFLSVLGYGYRNYKDSKMEAITNHGNGNYYYIDDIAEARKVLVEEAGGTLFTVARDVKLQVEFNPAAVKGYRLIGYENRTMAAEDFADDTKDGGELGAGHQITVLYEIIPADSDFVIPEVESRYGQSQEPSSLTADEWLVLNIRYKEPEGSQSNLLSYPLALDAYARSGGKMSPAMSWAAGMAQWGMLLRNSEYKGTTSFDTLLERLEGQQTSGGPGLDDFRKECLELIRASMKLRKH